ncbi:MAG: hypothetical protein CMP00_02465 [Woeseiaceae bacterium]|nr:hypothetical protein [Woeseiaceae bacterium]
MKLKKSKYHYAGLISFILLLVGCGQKGPLILPDEHKTITQSQYDSQSQKIKHELI